MHIINQRNMQLKIHKYERIQILKGYGYPKMFIIIMKDLYSFFPSFISYSSKKNSTDK